MSKKKELSEILQTTKFQESFTISSIPEEQKARKYVYSEFGSELGRNVKNYGRRDESQS